MTITYKYKLRVNKTQVEQIEEALRSIKFIRNKCLRYWIDNKETDLNVNQYWLRKYALTLRKEFPEYLSTIHSHSAQEAAERTWNSINRFYKACKNKVGGKKGYPKFAKSNTSLQFKGMGGYKLNLDTQHITVNSTIGTMKLMGDRFPTVNSKILLCQIVKLADGYYCHLVTNDFRTEQAPITSNVVGIDLGLKHFTIDSNGNTVDNPRFYRKLENKLKNKHRTLSRKKKGSNNRRKARTKLAKAYLKLKRVRADWTIKLARKTMLENDVVIVEKLQVKNMVRNGRLAKSINDAAWTSYVNWLDTYSKVFGKLLIKVNPKNTSQTCSSCGKKSTVKLTLADRVFNCEKCGFSCDRDVNAAVNILNKGLNSKAFAVGTTVGI